MSKYAPLKTFLSRQTRSEAAMSFSDIERVLGFRLPVSARKHQAWWANHAGTHVNAQAWLDAGWKTSRVELASERVVFVRGGVQNTTEAAAIIVPRAFLSDAALAMLADGDGDAPRAVADLINAAARAGRVSLVERFSRLSPRLTGDAVDMIRGDRDAR